MSQPYFPRAPAPMSHSSMKKLMLFLPTYWVWSHGSGSPSFKGNSGHVALGTWALLPRAVPPRHRRTFGVSQGLFVGPYLLSGLKDIKGRLVWPMKPAQ